MSEKNHITNNSHEKSDHKMRRYIVGGLIAGLAVTGFGIRAAKIDAHKRDVQATWNVNAYKDLKNGKLDVNANDVIAVEAPKADTPSDMASKIVGDSGEYDGVYGAILLQSSKDGDPDINKGDIFVVPKADVDPASIEKYGIEQVIVVPAPKSK